MDRDLAFAAGNRHIFIESIQKVITFAERASMMNRILLLFLILITCFLSEAQVFTGGINAGIAGSQVAGDTYSGYNKAGIFAGGFVNLKLSKHSDLQFELSYIQKGSRHNPDTKNGDYTFYLMQLGYVEMPVFMRYHLNQGLFLEAGPSFSVLLHSHEEIDYLTQTANPFSLFNGSVLAGLGYPISDHLKFEFRTYSSLLPIRKNRVTGDRYRLLWYGQFHDVILLMISYKL